MSNDNIPTKINKSGQSTASARITWELRRTDGFVTIIYSAASATSTFEEEVRVPGQTKMAHVSGSKTRLYKLKTLELASDELSDFSDTLIINYGSDASFSHADELESNGSTIHRTFSGTAVPLDDNGDWLDIWSGTDLANFRKMKEFTYTVAGSPVNLQMRLVEKTVEMDQFLEKLPPEELANEAAKRIVFSEPKPQIQKRSDIKLQVRVDAGTGAGATFSLDELEVVDYTLGSL